jgi:hypothetical protein
MHFCMYRNYVCMRSDREVETKLIIQSNRISQVCSFKRGGIPAEDDERPRDQFTSRNDELVAQKVM